MEEVDLALAVEVVVEDLVEELPLAQVSLESCPKCSLRFMFCYKINVLSFLEQFLMPLLNFL